MAGHEASASRDSEPLNAVQFLTRNLSIALGVRAVSAMASVPISAPKGVSVSTTSTSELDGICRKAAERAKQLPEYQVHQEDIDLALMEWLQRPAR